MAPTAAVTADRTAIRLSDTLTVTLRVEGPAPLQVDLPRAALTPESAAVWKITPTGPAILRPGKGGELWEQVFTLSPFVPGDEVPLAFHPVRVGGMDVSVASLIIRVDISLTAKADDARPVTEIEHLPPPPAAPLPVGPLLAVGLTGVFVAAVVFALLRGRRTANPLAPDEWVRRRLTELDADLSASRIKTPGLADGFTEVVRGYLTRRFHLTAAPLTTAELVAAADAAGVWDANTRTAIATILDVCDRVKFAGHPLSPDEGREWLEQVRVAVTSWAAPAN